METPGMREDITVGIEGEGDRFRIRRMQHGQGIAAALLASGRSRFLKFGIEETLCGAEIAGLLRWAIAGQFFEIIDKDVGVGLGVAEVGHESDQRSAGFLGNQVFDLAGVGLRRCLVHTEDLFEKGPENVPL